MSRESRRRLLLRAHAAAKRFCKKAEGQPYFVPATDAFVAGWLLGYRAHRRDILHKMNLSSLYGKFTEQAGGVKSATNEHTMDVQRTAAPAPFVYDPDCACIGCDMYRKF